MSHHMVGWKEPVLLSPFYAQQSEAQNGLTHLQSRSGSWNEKLVDTSILSCCHSYKWPDFKNNLGNHLDILNFRTKSFHLQSSRTTKTIVHYYCSYLGGVLEYSYILHSCAHNSGWKQQERGDPSVKVSCPKWPQGAVGLTWVHRQLGHSPAVWPRVSHFKLHDLWFSHLKNGATVPSWGCGLD